ncbi:SpoIIE family protein phosphatase [Quadrisphaera sp. DSM 44207]|uniref:SpoIIE family protein phosphatase n=1 Tax=Quadrisphaera sp. DSM 44207 TaxID=1881057 RepID=UPI00087EE9E6|nr:SpoIIE family protein phosphatase [Quadrisphaera sp. DSM 44207]SDQ87554.1 PAS domain S-box-containing protein [Quadrisphaera sp. DSM 44207]
MQEPPARALSRLAHEAGVAVLLVDLTTGAVLHANRAATALAGPQSLPLAAQEWARRAGLSTPSGHPAPSGQALSSAAGPVARSALGEPVAGELVHRDPRRSAGPSRLAGPLWVTGLPLGALEPLPLAAPPGLEDTALVLLVPVAAPVPAGAASGGLHELRERALVATGLAFTISDPSQEDLPLVWVNPAFTATTGYPPEQALGRNCRFLQGPDTDPAAVGRIRRALEREEGVVETLLNYRADGTAFWNELSLSPVFDAGGRLVSYVGVQADVTPRVLVQQERMAALAAEREARSRLALLADVADAVAELDSPSALREVAEVLVASRDSGWRAQWSAVLLVDGGVRVVAAVGVEDGVSRSSFPVPRGGFPGGEHDPLGGLLAGTTAGPVAASLRERWAPGTLTRWVAGELGAARQDAFTAIAVPGRRGALALLLLGADAPPGEDAAALLGEVARRVGLSLENVRLYAREHALAETLQRSMLPEHLAVPGLDLWSYYAPSAEHAQVGGDWYDVLPLGGGAVGLVVGDVVGHDVEAAASMGQLRSVVRAYAFEQEEPGTVVMRVDQLVNGMRISRSASMVYGRLRPLGPPGGAGGSAWELDWTRAGHLPPVLVRAGGDGRVAGVQLLDERGGTLVGVGDRPRSTASVVLGPGDVLVLYTDGLVERRSRPLAAGLERLREVCAVLAPSDAAGVGEQLLAALGDDPEDDLAVVVVRVPRAGELVQEPEGTPRQRRWQLPGDPSSIGRARRHVLTTCAAWRLQAGPEAELVVSELVANAVLHGWGPVGLRVRHTGRGLLVEVDDANPAPPQPRGGEAPGTGGYGLQVVERLAEWGWRRSGAGKTVWALLPALPAGDPS